MRKTLSLGCVDEGVAMATITSVQTFNFAFCGYFIQGARVPIAVSYMDRSLLFHLNKLWTTMFS